MEKNISHLVVAACMASMLTGCGIYTKYRQPETCGWCKYCDSINLVNKLLKNSAYEISFRR